MAVSATPIIMSYAAIAGCQEPLVVTVTPRKLPLRRANSHPVVQAVGFAGLVQVPAQ